MKKKIEEYLGPFVYGAIDGTVTTFAVVAASAGAGLDAIIIVVLGLANLIGDGFSMGASSYLAAKSERDLKIRKHKESGEKPGKNHDPAHGETPLADGGMTFAAFVAVGFIPLLVYVVDVMINLRMNADTMFIISGTLTAIIFIGVGLLKATVTRTGRVRAATETFVLGAVAAVLAYVLGDLLGRALGAS